MKSLHRHVYVSRVGFYYWPAAIMSNFNTCLYVGNAPSIGMLEAPFSRMTLTNKFWRSDASFMCCNPMDFALIALTKAFLILNRASKPCFCEDTTSLSWRRPSNGPSKSDLCQLQKKMVIDAEQLCCWGEAENIVDDISYRAYSNLTRNKGKYQFIALPANHFTCMREILVQFFYSDPWDSQELDQHLET